MLNKDGEDDETHAQLLKKTFSRFHMKEFVEIYVPATSPVLIDRLKLIYQVLLISKKNRKPLPWAKCCTSLERLNAKLCLGHPEDQMIDFREYFPKQLEILTEQAAMDIMLHLLPTNSQGYVLVPQINMKHRDLNVQPEQPDDLTLAEQSPKDSSLDPYVRLQQQLHSTEQHNALLSSRVDYLTAQFDAFKVVLVV